MSNLIVADTLVELNSPLLDAVPFTTADIVADHSLTDRKSVNRLITQYHSDLEEFGVLRFQIAKPPKGSKGGRPRKVYCLNEDQATLLLTYLDNTAPVRAFKKALVHEFSNMKAELTRRQTLREIERPMRRTLTDALQIWPYCNRWSYKAFTDLLCKLTTGKNTTQLKKERGADHKTAATDVLTGDELATYQASENKAMVLLGLGMTYEQIKAAMTGQALQITLPDRQPA